MDGASPSTSALTLYSYNGEKMYYSYIFDSGTTQNILDELDAVKTTKAKTWSLDDITLPIYGFHIVATDGSGIFVAWSNNYWISQDGTVYIFYFNFEKLVADYLTMNVGESSFSGFPRVRFLTQDENGWNTALLTPAKKLDIPDGITMTLDSWNNDVVTVTIANNRDMVWTYGVAYELQVLLDGVWYEISVTPGHWGFTSVALTIPGGAEREETYYLHMYGKLPAGTYRLVSHGISVENTIP
ncbi:MAG: hypothetical protein LBE70_01060 [Nitrososphaerota archaeon]|jgi:hypothetical protein|nr:hypothetical protein [Nitrososphaerota archaeon]